MNDTEFKDLTAEDFRFAERGEHIRDKKPETKPVGYFRDAWRRFKKNKASIAAVCIIVFLLLFALFAPIFSSYDMSFSDPVYRNKIPKNDVLAHIGIATGVYKKDLNTRAYDYYAGIGIGAAYDRETDTEDNAAAVGSDVSFMMRGGCARVRGTGGDVTALPPMEFDALAIDCGAVDTAAGYRTFDELALPFSSPTEGELLSPFNALRPAAERLNARLRDCAETAKRLGVAVSMTGSGGCMFVISPPAGTADAFREAGFRCFPVRSAACGVVFV